MMVGAAIDADVITAHAKEMAPALMVAMRLEDVDAAYTRWLQDALADPDLRSVMVDAHGLLSTWRRLQAEVAAAKAADLERKAADYRAEVEAELKRNPRKVASIADLARRDGVTLPYATGASEKPQETRQDWDGLYPPKEETEADRMAQAAKEERNRSVWLNMLADHERLVDKTERDGTKDATGPK